MPPRVGELFSDQLFDVLLQLSLGHRHQAALLLENAGEH